MTGTCTCPMSIPIRAGNGEVAAWRCSQCGLALPTPDPRDAEIAALKAAQDGIHAVGYREGVLAEREHSRKATADGDDEIARLKGEVERVTRAKNEAQAMVVDVHRAIGSPSDVSYENMAAHIASTLAAHKRALAAGPAALRAQVGVRMDGCARVVEAAQVDALLKKGGE